MELITGKTGTQHVYAIDDATVYKMITGMGDYVLEYGNKFAATMNGVNQVIVSDGAMIMQGRLARTRASSGTDTVSIDNGVSGYKRADLIVARYTKYEVEVEGVSETREKVELAVIKGANDAASYITPSYTTRDIDNASVGQVHEVPLWEVRLDGINFNSLIDHRVILNPVMATVNGNLAGIEQDMMEMAERLASSITSRFTGIYRGNTLGDDSEVSSVTVQMQSGYSYVNTDSFMVYINGFLLSDSEVSGISGSGASVTITFAEELYLRTADEIEVVAFR